MDFSKTTFAVIVENGTDPKSLDIFFSSLARFVGPGIRLFAIDNASGYENYFTQREIPVHSFQEAQPKVQLQNWIFKNCQTKYLVLLETNVCFYGRFLDSFAPTASIHTSIIDKASVAVKINAQLVSESQPTVDPSIFRDSFYDFAIMDIELLRSKGIELFDDNLNHGSGSYLNGSWLLEKAALMEIPAQNLVLDSEQFMNLIPPALYQEVLDNDVLFTGWGVGVFVAEPAGVAYA